jgi:hypothetical protein
MTTIELEKKYYNVPTEWNELHVKQLLDIIDIFYNKEYKPEEILLLLLKALLSFSKPQFSRMDMEDAEEYLYLCGFLFEDTSYLTKQLLPEYDHLHGPDEELNNVVMKEFVFSEHFFMQWQEDRDNDELLNDFIATIYRPAKRDYDHDKNPDGDGREKFNENLCEWYSNKMISKWPKNVKLAIAHWYAGCRRKIVDDNPDVFGGSGEAAKHGLISVIREIAKQGAHGNFEAVENMNINLVMVELNEIVEEGKQMEAQMKNVK